MDQDQAFVEHVVRAIVNNPDDVKATRTVDERGVLITLDVNPSDMAYVIGRQGQTARSIRTLLKIVGAKNNARVNLKINEPEGSTRPPRPASSASFTSYTPAPSTPAPSDDDIDTSAVDGLNI
ncbi:MAG: RNA-binding protein [Candidatus Magasanikbacteria bacterium CG_4_10_14_0_2_um_filter_37_12]|uniref:RNA-binding protein KhpA n=1 Tax=Candidatus Magasanikbacteria bacterium CG_4_10_14_0_2_um_filter_37_12 TaxID=1974637 RepID=A0A2M7V9A1_9BACT|nr:MAG: RNA-binding protein [Candidatus Magasanikbacteria bacterium CG_4_10_14_0_2_um_filter_37_12]